MRNKKYNDVYDVIRRDKFINSPSGARCTLKLKKEMRYAIEKLVDFDAQVFGFEFEEKQIKRAKRFTEQYPNSNAIFPLIESQMTKNDCIKLLLDLSIDTPAMYKLGYNNSNCIGCVKGGMGYWNKIRVDFPDYFNEMAKIEREINNSCLKRNGRKLFLDELSPTAGRHEDISLPECGVVCPVELF